MLGRFGLAVYAVVMLALLVYTGPGLYLLNEKARRCAIGYGDFRNCRGSLLDGDHSLEQRAVPVFTGWNVYYSPELKSRRSGIY